MPNGNSKLGGRWVGSNESPFGNRNSLDNQARRRLTSPQAARNAQWNEYLNRRANSGRRFPKP